MKRLICMLLLALLLSGCAGNDPITFYYTRHPDSYAYGTEDAVIAPEKRKISGQEGDLTYFLRLYLEGPLSDNMVSPFPSGTYLLTARLEEETLTLVLSQEYASLEEIDLTLASACLARTCFDLTDAGQVQIIGGEKTVTMSRDGMVLMDDSVPETTEAK